MRNSIVVSATFTAVSALLMGGEPLKQGERDRAMSHMHATRKLFLDSVAGLSKEQWNYKASPERWSIAECAEHIAASDPFLFGLVSQMSKGPAAKPEEIEKTKGKDDAVIKMVPDRTAKFQAPEPIKPKRMLEDPAEYVAKFKAARDKNIKWVETTDGSLRDKVTPHPAMGPLDAYQWLLLMSAHTERHVLQILEVKADAGFPKN